MESIHIKLPKSIIEKEFVPGWFRNYTRFDFKPEPNHENIELAFDLLDRLIIAMDILDPYINKADHYHQLLGGTPEDLEHGHTNLGVLVGALNCNEYFGEEIDLKEFNKRLARFAREGYYVPTEEEQVDIAYIYIYWEICSERYSAIRGWLGDVLYHNRTPFKGYENKVFELFEKHFDLIIERNDSDDAGFVTNVCWEKGLPLLEKLYKAAGKSSSLGSFAKEMIDWIHNDEKKKKEEGK